MRLAQLILMVICCIPIGVAFGLIGGRLIIFGSIFSNGAPPKGTRWSLYVHHLGNYMHRWILLTPFGTMRLHHILRSDDDRHLHDHPFDFTSFLLTGGYIEESLLDGIRVAVPQNASKRSERLHREKRIQLLWPRFSIVRKKAEEMHRLILVKPLWTLVFSGPKRREWGFHTEKGWILHSEYFNHFPEVIDRRLGSTDWRRTGL